MVVFRPGVVLTLIGVAAVHGALLLLLSGAPPVPEKMMRQQVIQGVLLAPPVPEVPKKAEPVPEKKPLRKTVAEKRVVEKVREVPAEKIPEEIVEPVKPVEEVVAERPAPEVAEQFVEEVVEASSPAQAVVTPPRIDNAGHLKNPPPDYPRLSKRLREEGEVILELWVQADGTVSKVEIKTSSGYPRLDKAALKAVKKWRYTPATHDGEPIAYRYRQPIQFSMK